jgi:hypothetical protein
VSFYLRINKRIKMNKYKNNIGLNHSKDACHLTPSSIRPSIKLIQNILNDLDNNISLVTFTNDYGYVFLSRGQNKKLFSLLDTSGFWNFHCTNTKRKMCSLHQIVLYVWKGWNLFLKGYTCNFHACEIHHIDHDPSNNNLDNLVYVTSQENKLLSDICRFTYNGTVKSAAINPFGQGNRKSKFTRIIKLIKVTFTRTFERLGLKTPPQSSFEWLLNLPQDLSHNIVSFWQSCPPSNKSFLDSVFS